MQDFAIFCDLDGVLVDLSGRMSQIYKEKLSNHGFTDKFYKLMDKLTPVERLEFWSNLDETEDCMELWNFIKQFDPHILTSCSGMAAACLGKKNWCSEHLEIKLDKVICVQHSEDKQNYAGKNKILIDDLPSNITEWENKGGIGILHKRSNTTLKLLKSILYTKYDTYDI
jgi:phosphoglycolate phosphatase-like HAD superfamily hydrolase